MQMEENYDETFLARWLADELTEEELSAFKGSKTYSEYKLIIEGVDRLEAPSYDRQKNYDATLAKIDKLTTPKPKVKTLLPNWAYAVAASVVLFVGYLFFFQTTTYETQLADTTTFELPDGSTVYLNADSKLNFKSFNWDSNRIVNLTGEAFFKVEKGSTFTVKTKEGNVKVLGTQFTVTSRDKLYQVNCYEGKVAVTTQNISQHLTKGKACTLQNNNLRLYDINDAEPSWLSQESSFNNILIHEVVAEIERQYNITIKGKEHLKKQHFTGRFKHQNLSIALKTVFDTMEIPYTFDTDSKLVSIQPY